MQDNIYRTKLCGDLSEDDLDKEITVCGFVDSIRDHGGILFLDLRDSEGILQVKSENNEMFAGLRKESVVQIHGRVIRRSLDDINDKIKSGKVELVAYNVKVLSECLVDLPFEIKTSKNVSEDIRLKYRYLDLRNPKMHKIVLLRSKVLNYIRNIMVKDDFIEVETPILTTSSPEGARDFVVPSRLYHGKFYALPQAPQIYKQLLMVSGFNKYFQIAPCFRDEDTRSDRTLEFYQLDIETSYPEIDQLYKLGESICLKIFKKFSDKKLLYKKFQSNNICLRIKIN